MQYLLEVLQGSPGAEIREAAEELRRNGGSHSSACKEWEVLRPWEKLGCASRSLIYQQAVEQALIASKLEKSCCFLPLQIESTTYIWIHWWAFFFRDSNEKLILKIQSLSQKHFQKIENFEKVVWWAKNLAVYSQIEERLSGSFIFMLFLRFTWKPLGFQTEAVCKRKWKMYLNISVIKTTGMQGKNKKGTSG